MATISAFNGFSGKCLDFYRDLAANNNKTWFEAHRDVYENEVLEPARNFVVAMGLALESIAPAIHAEPKVNRSLFKIFRDTRFSKDKTPFKDHLAMFFWEGPGKRMESAGFYFGLSPDRLWLGGGAHTFTKPQLKEFRNSVVHPEHGPALVEAVEEVRAAGLEIGGQTYKRTPRGFDKDHPLAEYLLFSGVWARQEIEIPEALFTAGLVDHVFGIYVDMLPIHRWCRKMIARCDDQGL